MRARVPLTLGTMAVLLLAALVAVSSPVKTARAAELSGAIFTTDSGGTEVNANIYTDKGDVYLNGGPGPGNPNQNAAAGLPDGTYVFQVTDPSGKTLLSQDAAQCREFVVSGGIIVAYVSVAGCTDHLTGANAGDGSTTIQLMPYADTPNHGNEYKVWATPLGGTPLAALVGGGFPTECLTSVPTSCSTGKFGFTPAFSKTDNFKVNAEVLEIDTRFQDSATGALIDGLGITWTDTLGASNHKWSYYNQALDINHEAHVEAPENGTHLITINDQPGCNVVGPIQVINTYTGKSYYTSVSGAQTVSVNVSPSMKTGTIFLYVTCG